MFFDCLCHSLLEPFRQDTPRTTRPLPTAGKHILYGYFTIDTTPQQLANYLLVLANTKIYKTHLATDSAHRLTPDYQSMFRMRLQYRLYIEMHYSLWASFRGYWLHGDILWVALGGRIIFSEKT
jgi:hypothetical protein